jgi:hypothetical protein
MASKSTLSYAPVLSRAWLLVPAAAGLVACSSNVATECEKEAESLTIRTAADVEAARDIGRVSGEVAIFMDPGEAGPSDLSFLDCLVSAESLRIYEAPELVTTAGATKLTELGSLRVAEADKLERIEGFDGVEDIEQIRVYDLPTLVSIDLPHVEHVGRMEIGMCAAPPSSPYEYAINPALSEIGPFESLRAMEVILVMGNSALTSLSLLKSLHDNGAPPLRTISIAYNPKLSQVDIDRDLTALGAAAFEIEGSCGNLGSKMETCTCPWGE